MDTLKKIAEKILVFTDKNKGGLTKFTELLDKITNSNEIIGGKPVEYENSIWTSNLIQMIICF